MDTSKLCMYCMEDNGGNDICPHCGKDANAPLIGNHLKPGDVIGGRFLVGRAVGQDATGVVYMVYDTMKGNKLRIREYLPRGIAERGEDGMTLGAAPGMAEQFDEGLAEMMARAESAEDPSRAMAYFEENGTLYVVLRKKKAAAAAAAAVALPDDEEAPDSEDEDPDDSDEEEESETLAEKLKKHMTTIMICLLIVLLLIASIFIMISRSSTDNTDQPQNSNNPLDEWSAPTETPIPTVAATDEFGNIVKPEQGWQNQQGGENLDNWGEPQNTQVPDDYEPDWLTQATDVPMNTSTPTPEPTIEPTAEITPEPTAEPKATIPPEMIDRHSDEEIISMLQARLIELGWLDIEAPTGQYGDMTREAVEDFQRYVRDHRDDEMDVDGYAGAQTIEWLNREDAPKNPEVYPEAEATATPAPVVTPAPDMIGAEKLIPMEEEIDADSDKDAISRMQARLIELGWLDIDEPTGTFADMTRRALRSFQRHINNNLGGALEAEGRARVETIEWLNRLDAPANPEVYPDPTAAPDVTAEPEQSAEPEATADPSVTETPADMPDPAVIEEVQTRLIELGWMDESQHTGVYDNATVLAIKDYQTYLNQINPNAELPENGYPDENTVLWLRWDSAPQRPDVLPQVTETPEPTATPEPFVAPFEVNPESPEEDILWLQNKLNELKWTDIPQPSGVYDEYTIQAVTNLQHYLNTRHSLTLTADGMCDSVTTSYLNNDYNRPTNGDESLIVTKPETEGTQDPNEAPGAEGTATPEPENTSVPAPVMTDTPATGVPEIPATDVPATAVPTDVPTEEPTAVPTDVPTEEPTAVPTDVPTEEPTAAPTETPAPTEEPSAIDVGYTKAETINVRAEATTASEVVTKLVGVGTEVEVLGKTEADADGHIWYWIRYTGSYGFVRGDLLTLKSEQTAEPTDAPATDAPATDVPATDVPATDVPATDVPATDAPATDVPATDVPTTDAPATDVPATDAPATDVPATDAPATDAPATDAPATDVPATDVPATDVPATDVPATDVPATDVPATDVLATDAPATDVPATDVPATDAPATDVPATDVPATDVPATDVPEVTASAEPEATATVEPVPTATVEPTATPEPEAIGIVYTKYDTVNVRSEAVIPDQGNNVVAQVVGMNTELEVVEKTEADANGRIWYLIRFEGTDGRVYGYVREDTVSTEPVAEPNEVSATEVPATEVPAAATPEPTPTYTPEPTATPEPTPTYTPEPTATPEPTPTYTPEPTATPEPTPTYTPEPTATPEPTPTYTPEPTATPEPTPTYTPEPTATPEPTVDPNTFIDSTTEDTGRIRAFQQWLIDLQWLSGSPSGEYDAETRQAVAAFQKHLVENRSAWNSAYGNADRFIPDLALEEIDGSRVEEKMLKLFGSAEFNMKPELFKPNPPAV